MNKIHNEELDPNTEEDYSLINDLANSLWNYVHLNQDLRDQNSKLTGFIIALGSTDEQTAIRAGNLFLEGNYEGIICSGGAEPKQFIEKFGKPLTEAEVFASIIEKRNVERAHIQLETKARNTKENIILSLELLVEKRDKLENKPIILVCAPTQERRVWATAKKIDPSIDWRATSNPISFKEYINSSYREGRIRALMGQIIRLKLYGIKGDIEPQEIPENIEDAYNNLLKKGYEPIALESIREDMNKYGLEIDLSLKEKDNTTEGELNLVGEGIPSPELRK